MNRAPQPLPQGFLDRPIAHRGLHDATRVENTAPAFSAAIEANFGIECDVTPSLEREAMVFHDETLDRLTRATGPLAAQSAEALRAIPFRTGTVGMETLGALFAQVAGRVPLVVEVKSAFDGQSPLAPRISALAAGYVGPLVFKSFDPTQILALRAAGVRQPLGLVAMLDYSGTDFDPLDKATRNSLAALDHLAQTRPDFLSYRAADLPEALPLLREKAPGLPLMSWTVRDQATATRIAPYVDQIVFEGFRPRSDS